MILPAICGTLLTGPEIPNTQHGMTFPPILDRELRAATRARATYLTRVIAGLGALLLSCWMILTVSHLMAPERLGASMFRALTYPAFFGCLFAGVFLTADSLSEEKRNGTLGLLFLTSLTGREIVLGKLIVTSLHAFYGLLAIFPALAIPFFLGGVTAGEFWRISLVLTNTMFLSLVVGMSISAFSWREHRAMVTTTAVLSALAWGTAALGALWPGWNVLSPLHSFELAYEVNYRMTPGHFFSSLLAVHLLGWSGLLLASWAVRHFWREGGAKQRRSTGSRRLFNQRPLFVPILHPIIWLARRGERRRWIWVSLLLPSISFVWRQYSTAGTGFNPYFAVMGTLCLHLILQFWIAWEAARRLNMDRRAGGLEMLLSTPMTTDQIIAGQMSSLRMQFAGPLLAVLVTDFLLMFVALPSFSGRSAEVVEFVTIFLALMIVLVVSAQGLAWLGLWLGLRMGRAAQATLGNLVRIVILPTGLFMLATFFLVVAGTARGASFLTALAVLWLVIGSANAYVFAQDARLRLQSSFRQVANGTNDPSPILVLDEESDYSEDFSLLASHKAK